MPKQTLLGESGVERSERREWKNFKKLGAVLLGGVFGCRLYSWNVSAWGKAGEYKPVCPQTTALLPEKNAELAKNLTDLYVTDKFHEDAATWLSGAVKVP